MKIVTPYGRSFTQKREAEKKGERRLRLKSRQTRKFQEDADIPQFVAEDPHALIAAWISMVDKIYRKPKGGKRPSKQQFEARQNLGNACWEVLRSREPFRHNAEIDKLSQIWRSKLHPYPHKKKNGEDNFDDDSGKGFDDTVWAERFNAKPSKECQYRAVAALIGEHLHNQRFSVKKGSGKETSKGLIAERAQSISKNTLANHMSSALIENERHSEKPPVVRLLKARIDDRIGRCGLWSESDQKAFTKFGDVARQIYSKNSELESADKIFKRRTIRSGEAIDIIHTQYGKQFQQAGGQKCKKRKHIESDGQAGLLALYDAARAYYRKLLRRTQKNGRDKPIGHTLPKNSGELLSLLRNAELNRVTNDLVRLGRVLHYESSLSDQDGFEGIEDGDEFLPESWNDCLNSNYWTSAGQADIKRTEAFVRVWRNAISQASRTLQAWTDPEQKRSVKGAGGTPADDNNDILDARNIEPVGSGQQLDFRHARTHLKILFGRDAELFTDGAGSQADPKLAGSCFAALTLARLARNEIVHFRGRRGFIEKLKQLGNPDAGLTQSDRDRQRPFKDLDMSAIENLYRNDEARARERAVRECESAHLHKFTDSDTLMTMVSALVEADESELVLPHYNKLLKGLHNLQQYQAEQADAATGAQNYVSNGLLTLPAPAKEEELKTPWKLARFIGSRLIYDRLFRPWLFDQNAEKLNGWIAEAQSKATERARLTAREKDPSAMADIIESKASSILTLKPGQNLSHLFDDLAHETASEMRVQKGYDSNPEQARKQMKWIEDFKYHIVAQAFLAYLSDPDAGRIYNWVLQLDENSVPRENAPPPGDDPRFAGQSSPMVDEESEPWVSNLYYLLHMIPVDDVSQLLHQFRKWSVLENKSTLIESGSGTGASSEVESPRDGQEADVKRVISVFSLYLRMADDKYVWERDRGTSDINDTGLAAVRGFFESDAAFKSAFPLQENEEEHRLAVTRRGIRQVMRFGHLNLLTRQFGDQKITGDDVMRVLEAENDSPTGIAARQKDRDALHKRAVDALRADNTDDFSRNHFQRYKKLVQDISAHKFAAEYVRLNTHVRYHRLLMRLLSRLIDYSGIWERDRYFMMLALMKLYGETPGSVLHRGAGKFRREGKIPAEISGGGAEFQRACELVNIAPNPHTSNGRKARLIEIRDLRNDLAHFKILPQGRQNLNFTSLVNNVRKMMSYDRKLKNAVSKSIIEILHEEGFELSWRMDANHHLREARLKPRNIEHLKDWRAEERQRRRRKINRTIEETDWSQSEKSEAKRRQSELRNKEFENGDFSCPEQLKSEHSMRAVAGLFAD